MRVDIFASSAASARRVGLIMTRETPSTGVPSATLGVHRINFILNAVANRIGEAMESGFALGTLEFKQRPGVVFPDLAGPNRVLAGGKQHPCNPRRNCQETEQSLAQGKA
jgi:hypothetical protein